VAKRSIQLRLCPRPGDMMSVTQLDRLARSTRDVLNAVAAIIGKKAAFPRSVIHGPTPQPRTEAA
jgi:hypothetical protein